MNPKRQQLSQIVKEHDGDDHRHSETTTAYVYIDTQRWSHDGARKEDLVELTGIEPVTSCLQSRRSPN